MSVSAPDSSTTPVKGTSVYASDSKNIKAELSTIDDSVKYPAMVFLVSGLLWLLFGSLLGLIASWKLHDPNFMSSFAETTFGRIRSAHLTVMAYGWATNAAFAMSLWIMARLSRAPVRHFGLLYFGAFLWNLGVTVGYIGILKGDMISVEWLEFPAYATPMLVFAYAFIGLWGILSFRYRRCDHVYVSQWYILGALFWFPWLYMIAQIMIVFFPATGVVQSLVNWWFAHNVLGLWLTPIGLATIYYLIPKVLGKPIHSYYLSLFGFWTLALFYNWAGVHHLIGGPVPAWVISAGIVGSIMMVMPVTVTAINHHMTMIGSFRMLKYSPTLRFVVFGGVSYTLASLIGSTMALRSVSEVTHFTHFTVGHAHHGVYAFFTMVMFGGFYYAMPRLLKKEWPSAMLIRTHFWFVALGITGYIVVMSIAGILQGLAMNNADIPFVGEQSVVSRTIPFLIARSLSGMAITIGHIAFAINVFWMIFTKRKIEGPTLFVPKEIEEGGKA